MKTRVIPCTECRIRRRKCIRINSDKCDRCETFGLECLQSAPKKAKTTDRDIRQPDYDHLHEQIEELEWAIQQLQWEMNNVASSSSNNSVASEDTTSRVTESSMGVRSNSSVTSYSSLMRLDDATQWNTLSESLLAQLMSKKWQFKIKNGQFQIETGIRNLSDLLKFLHNNNQTNNISYLSPLASTYYSSSSSEDDDMYSNSQQSSYRGGSSGFLLQFGSNRDDSAVSFLAKLLSRCALMDARRPAIEAPISLYSSNYRAVIDQLIRTYFSCHNPLIPIFHKASFMKRYNEEMKDPMRDLLCLSISCYMCSSSTCDHLHFFSAKDKRHFADFFYAKAKSRLLDQFDDPDKKLDNIMSINMMARYLHSTLKIKECRELITLSYQICVDLSREYQLPGLDFAREHTSLDDYVPQSSSPSFVKPEETPIIPLTEYNINRMLFSRHVCITLSAKKQMDFIANASIKNTRFNYPYWQVMEDEVGDTRRYIYSQNYFFKLINHPFMSHFMNETSKVQNGAVCTLSFESIVRMEDAVQEWVRSVPKEYRLCNDYLDPECCRQAIAQSTDMIMLLSYMHYTVLIIMIYGSLLKPIALRRDADQILSFVQNHSLEKTLAGCRLMIYTCARIAEIDTKSTGEGHNSYVATDFLHYGTDVLILLSLSPNPLISREARIILRSCLEQMQKLQLRPQDNFVPREMSPIFRGTMDVNNASTFDLEFYDQFPDPWAAMIYDVIHYIASIH